MSDYQINFLNNLQPQANILVVDDIPDTIQYLTDILTQQGYKVRVEASGQMALAAVRAEPPDLILLDIMMPGMNGYEVCEQLKADKDTSNIPVIFISAINKVADKVKALSLGGADYIAKPFHIPEVLARVKTHLSIRNLQKDIEQRNSELALFNEIGQIFSSTLDLEQVLETILEEIRYALDVVSVSLWLVEPETNDLVCQHAKGPGSDIVGLRLAPSQGITGWVVQHGESALIPDTWLDERHLRDSDQPFELSVRSMLIVPLKVKNEAIGVLDIVDARVNFFTSYDLTLLEPIAASAAIAIENARLFQQEHKAKQAVETASAVTFAVNNSLDLEANLEKALEIVLQTMQLDQAWLFLPEDNGAMLRMIVALGFPDEFHHQETFTPADRCGCGEILANGELRCHFEENVCLRLTPYLEQFPVLSTLHISLPIFAKQQTIGLLNLGGTNVVNLTPNDFQWLKTVSQQIGNAIDNASLYQNALGKAERLSVLSRISTIISRSWKLDEILPPVLSEVARVLGMSLGIIVLHPGTSTSKYKARTHFGHWQSQVNFNDIAWHELPLLKIIERTQAPLFIPTPAEDDRLKPLSILIEQENIQALVVLPLVVQNQLVGFIQLCALSPGFVFEAAEIELARTLTNQAAVAIEKARLYEATVARYEEELETARQIQQYLLPRTVPDMPGFRLTGLCQPAYAIGGDFYDYIFLSDHRLSIVVGDVTGKSLPAAMVMTLARNTIRSSLVDAPHSAEEAMTIANRWLCQDIQSGTFVATVQALIDPHEYSMWLVNAGQTATLLYRNGQIYYLLTDEAAGFPLGIQPDTTYTQIKIPLQSGDIFLFYTDGIVEAKNIDEELYGFDRLESSMQNIQPNLYPQQIIDALLVDLQAFVGQAEQHDDITLVVMQVE